MTPTMSQASSMWSIRMVESTLTRYTLDKAFWNYDHALLTLAIGKAGEAKGEQRYLDFVAEWVDLYIRPDGSIRTYKQDAYSVDLVMPGRLLFGMYERTGEARYRTAIETLRQQMRDQPRTRSNGFWHKQIYPNQMWLDGIYMAGPFMAEYARRFDEPNTFDDIAHQVSLIAKHTRDPESGLMYHAFDESRAQGWCDPETGLSKHFWGRAVGWFTLAMLDLLELFPADHAGRTVLLDNLRSCASAALAVQDEKTGLWWQILDLPDREGNYLESSISCMFTYAFARGVREGYLAQEFLPAARRGFRGLLDHRITIDDEGLVTLEQVVGGTGLGGQPHRDGSFEYYVGEKIVPNDPKGVGPFILAALELEREGIQEERSQ